MDYSALDKLETLTGDHPKASNEGLHESPTVRSAGRRAIADLLLLANILLLFNTWAADVGNAFKPDYIKTTFCVENHLLPSFFVIGVQKCGTTTLGAILKTFEGISHGLRKEHHYFEFDHETNDTSKYYNQYPICKKAYRTYDNSPSYTNPDSKSAEKIKAFYKKIGIPLESVSFIAMVCQNFHRLRSAYYHHVSHDRHKINDMIFPFNNWFNYTLLNRERNVMLRRGFYDEIFGEYFHTFPQSSFLIIDSYAAFEDQQALANALAVFLKIKKITLRTDIWRNKQKQVQEEWNEYNTLKMELFYEHHEKVFVDKLKQLTNVETFPKVGFFGET